MSASDDIGGDEPPVLVDGSRTIEDLHEGHGDEDRLLPMTAPIKKVPITIVTGLKGLCCP